MGGPNLMKLMERMAGGGRERPEPKTIDEVIRLQQRAIRSRERRIRIEERRLEAMQLSQKLLEDNSAVREYLRLVMVANDDNAGESEIHDLEDDCGEEDCPVHGEANKVRG